MFLKGQWQGTVGSTGILKGVVIIGALDYPGFIITGRYVGVFVKKNVVVYGKPYLAPLQLKNTPIMLRSSPRNISTTTNYNWLSTQTVRPDT